MAYNFKNVRVLVVECTPSMYQLVKSVLSMLTVPERHIYAAYGPEEAFDKFKSIKHDIIITDWLQNPDLGIKLTKMIRQREDSPNEYVPIIMTAGTGNYNSVIKARDAGVSDYIVKPFSAQTMADRLVRVIEDDRTFVVSEHFTGPDRRHKIDKSYAGPERRSQHKEVELTPAMAAK